MPVQTAKKAARKTVDKARQVIRKHWSSEEAGRRREMASLMQERLVKALGLQSPAPR